MEELKYSYEEIKEFLLNFGQNTEDSARKQQKLKEMATQLGFTFHDCGCTSLTNDLLAKLQKWLKSHKELCHYRLSGGVLLRLKNGEYATVINFNDDMARELLEDENNKPYVTQILPFTETQEQPVTEEEVSVLEQKSASKKGKKISKNKK